MNSLIYQPYEILICGLERLNKMPSWTTQLRHVMSPGTAELGSHRGASRSRQTLTLTQARMRDLRPSPSGPITCRGNHEDRAADEG
ncbi:hypothetical protein CHARACLAT_031725 [Characodon lateralis]|uniref:Uncharacterized protein n=1 Tax=Characodon lateralis TaxID=208331 RepID=A0ABU7E9E2_9TELE|nr:hypothetical protein [Characodon lateralis]